MASRYSILEGNGKGSLIFFHVDIQLSIIATVCSVYSFFSNLLFGVWCGKGTRFRIRRLAFPLSPLLGGGPYGRVDTRWGNRPFSISSEQQCSGSVFGLPDPDPLVRGMDPDPDPFIIGRNTLIPIVLWLLLDFFKKECKCTFKK